MYSQRYRARVTRGMMIQVNSATGMAVDTAACSRNGRCNGANTYASVITIGSNASHVMAAIFHFGGGSYRRGHVRQGEPGLKARLDLRSLTSAADPIGVPKQSIKYCRTLPVVESGGQGKAQKDETDWATGAAESTEPPS